MSDPRNLARHLRDCRYRGQRPITDAADAKLWFLALNELIRRSALTDAAYAAPHLAATFPDSVFIGRQALLLDRMPAPIDDPAFADFVDRGDAQIQIVPRRGATTILLAFCGRHGSLGLPIPIAHRWFGRLGVHVVYLRDPAGELYASGLPALAPDRTGTVQALRVVADNLGASRLVCYGNSNGGLAALLYGLELQAAAVLSTNAVTIFPTEYVLARMGHHMGSPGHADLDLASAYAAAAVRPRVHLVHGANNPGDAASAAVLSGLEGVVIEAVPDCDAHDAHVALIERGRFGALLRDFVAGWPGGDRDRPCA